MSKCLLHIPAWYILVPGALCSDSDQRHFSLFVLVNAYRISDLGMVRDNH